MKRRYAFLIYVGIVALTFGCFLLSAYTQNLIFIFVLVGAFFLLGIISIPFYIRRIRREYERQSKMENADVIDDINQQPGYNKLEHDVQQIRAVVETWKTADKKDIVKGIIFALVFLSCIIGFAVCMTLEHMVLGFIFFGLGVGEILLALIVVKLLERRSLKFKKGRQYQKTTAIVLSSTMSSQSSTGTRRHVHIMHTVYKITLKLNEKNIVTYSEKYYNVGDKVYVNVDTKNPKIVQIIEKYEDPFSLNEDEF